jgi:hypothetical protein
MLHLRNRAGSLSVYTRQTGKTSGNFVGCSGSDPASDMGCYVNFALSATALQAQGQSVLLGGQLLNRRRNHTDRIDEDFNFAAVTTFLDRKSVV